MRVSFSLRLSVVRCRLSTLYSGLHLVGDAAISAAREEPVHAAGAVAGAGLGTTIIGGQFSGLGAPPIACQVLGGVAGAVAGHALVSRLGRLVRRGRGDYLKVQAPVPPAAHAYNFGYKG